MGGQRFDWKKNPNGKGGNFAPVKGGGLLGAAKRALKGRGTAMASGVGEATGQKRKKGY